MSKMPYVIYLMLMYIHQNAGVHQPNTTDTGLAPKLDKFLASLGLVKSRFEKFEKKDHGYHSSSNARHHKPFTGNCFGCGQPGHSKYRLCVL